MKKPPQPKTDIIKHYEVKSYKHLGIKIRIAIDYDREKISLLDQAETSKPKRWLFAERGLEYMDGWQDILSAMKYAIEMATDELRTSVKAKEKKVADLFKPNNAFAGQSIF